MSVNDLAARLGDACYGFLLLNFFWGLFSVIMAFRRVWQLSFRNRQQQQAFMEELIPKLDAGQYAQAAEMCAEDRRALPQLANVAILNRNIGFDALKQSLTELLTQDVLGELEYRTGWIATTIKSGPLLGLFGTVLGMMASFGRIGLGEKVQPHMIAKDISIALICTALGLATAIPFNFLLAAINIRIRRLQESLASGLVQVLEHFRRRGT
ncbi:MAG TPA: MotA/TolQ/ExbB proton channel family protein [Pirellulaceae bacterium]|jgi:biopolymer transport protein ExbB/TolQ